jgi:hypothetical protein
VRVTSGSPYLFSRACETRKFRPKPPWMDLRRSGKQVTIHVIYSVPENKCDPRPFPIDGRLVVLPPDTDDGNSRNGK